MRCRRSATGHPVAARKARQWPADLRAGLGDPDPAEVRERLVALDLAAPTRGWPYG